MAFMLIEPRDGYKGVIIFKHLELPLLKMMRPSLIAATKERYLIGLYIGFSIILKADPEFVDFYVAADNVLTISSASVLPRLPLNGFNFIDSYIRSQFSEKKYDFLYIGNSFSRKNLLEFIRGVRDVLRSDTSASFLIINRYARGIESSLYVRRVRSRLNNFPAACRSRVCYIELPPSSDPLPSLLVAQALGLSRSLVIASRSEGAARVVAEAALNNMPIIYYAKMKGGTTNHMSESVDVPFSDCNSMGKVMLDALNHVRLWNSERRDTDVYLEAHSKNKLKEFLCENFNFSREILDQSIDGRKLYNAFSGHQNLLPERFSSKSADEILMPSKMYDYLCFLCGKEANAFVMMNLRVRHQVSRLFALPMIFAKSVFKGLFM